MPVGSRTTSSPASKMRTIVGCAILAASCASRRNRVRNAGSFASVGLSSLIGDAATEAAVGADVDVGHAAAPDEFTDLVAAREHAHALRYAVNHELSPGASGGRSLHSVPARV